MLNIAGHLTIAAGERDRYPEHGQPIVARARTADGCLDVALSADLSDPDRVAAVDPA